MIGIILAVGIISACISIGASVLLMRRYSDQLQETIEPQFSEVRDIVSEVQTLLEEARPQIKRSQSIISQHGVEPRQVKTAEKYLAEDLIDNYPEIKGILGMISPRTTEYFEENPDILLTVAERWGPKLKLLMGEVNESGSLSGSRAHPFAGKEE